MSDDRLNKIFSEWTRSSLFFSEKKYSNENESLISQMAQTGKLESIIKESTLRRISFGITQEQVGKALDISKMSISNLEACKTGNYSHAYAYKYIMDQYELYLERIKSK